MQPNSLRYFYEAAQLGSMRAASDKLGVAVSSISRQIAGLETELGLLLLERGRRNIKLTEAGELALSYYRKSLAEREVFDSRVRDLRGMRAGRVDLAVGEGFITTAFSDVLNAFLTKNAGIRVNTILTGGTAEVVRKVVEDEVHAGLVFQVPSDPRVRIKASVPQPVMLICRPDHALAGLEHVTLDQISGHRICLTPEGFRIRELIAAAEMAAGVWLEAALVSNSLLLLKEMVKSGDCVTIMPSIAAGPEIASGTLKAVPIATPALESTTINLITRLGRQLPAAPTRLLSVLEANLKKWK